MTEKVILKEDGAIKSLEDFSFDDIESHDWTKYSTEELVILLEIFTIRFSKDGNSEKVRKILMNSLFGATGNVSFRYFDLRAARSITLSGQLAIRWISQYIMNHPLQKKYKWNIIYSDTDSVYCEFSELRNAFRKKNPNATTKDFVEYIDSFGKKVMEPIIKSGYKKLQKYVNAPQNKMVMKREKISQRMILPTSKKYGLMVWDNEGVRYDKAKLSITGLATVSTRTPGIVKERLKAGIEYMMMDQAKISKHMADSKKWFYDQEPEDVTLNIAINKYFEYVIDHGDGSPITWGSRTGQGIKAAVAYNNFIRKHNLVGIYQELGPEFKVKVLFMKIPNIIGNSDVFGFIKKIPKRDEILEFYNKGVQFHKVFEKPLTDLMGKIRLHIRNSEEFDIDDLLNNL